MVSKWFVCFVFAFFLLGSTMGPRGYGGGIPTHSTGTEIDLESPLNSVNIAERYANLLHRLSDKLSNEDPAREEIEREITRFKEDKLTFDELSVAHEILSSIEAKLEGRSLSQEDLCKL